MKWYRASWGLALRLLLSIGVSLLISTCSGAAPSGNAADNGGPNDAYGRALITPEGGTVRGPGGSMLVVPAGALSEETWVTLHESSDGSELGMLTPANGAVDLEPTGLTFSVPARLTIAAESPLSPGSTFPLMQLLPASQEWRVTPFLARVSADGLSYTAEIDLFSSYGSYSPGSLLLADTAEAVFNCATGGDMDALFDEMIESFRDMCWRVGRTFADTEGQCREVTGIEYVFRYRSDCAFEEEGELAYLDGDYGGEDVIRYALSREYGVDYCEVEINVFLNCGETTLELEARPATVGIYEESTVAVTCARCGSSYFSVPQGSTIDFAVVSGPGEINPEQESSWGAPLLAETTFTAEEVGEARVRARVLEYSCRDHEGETVLYGSTTINVATDGHLVYDHSVTMTYSSGGGSSTQTETITGSVPFEIAPDTGELSGSGSVTTSGSGVSVFGDTQCQIEIAGGATVSVSGYLDHGTLNVILDEAWSKTITVTCPDGPPGETTSNPTVQFSFQAPHEDGYVVERPPADPNLSGYYRWTLDLSD